MKKFAVIAVAACSLALSTCGASTGNSSQSAQASAPTSQPTLSAAEAKKLAAEEKAYQEANAEKAQKRATAVEKVVKTEPSTAAKLSVIITEYCNINRDPGDVEKAEISLLEQLYSQHWQAGRWNKTLASAAMQQGACPDTLPRFEG